MILCSPLVLDFPENRGNILLILVFPVPKKHLTTSLYFIYIFVSFQSLYDSKSLYSCHNLWHKILRVVSILYLHLYSQNPAEFHILRRCSANFSWVKSNWISANKLSFESSSLKNMNDARWYYWRKIYWRLYSLVAQIVMKPPVKWETWVWSLGWEDPLEESMATHSSILAWRIPMDRGAWQATVHGVAESQTRLSG